MSPRPACQARAALWAALGPALKAWKMSRRPARAAYRARAAAWAVCNPPATETPLRLAQAAGRAWAMVRAAPGPAATQTYQQRALRTRRKAEHLTAHPAAVMQRPLLPALQATQKMRRAELICTSMAMVLRAASRILQPVRSLIDCIPETMVMKSLNANICCCSSPATSQDRMTLLSL